MKACRRLFAGLFVLAACRGGGPPTPESRGGSATSPAPPAPAASELLEPTGDAGAGAERTAASDATAPEAGAAPEAAARPPRPVVFYAFRRSAQYGKADRVSPRSAVPDGEPDAVFELVLEGDVAALVLYDAASSTSARTETPAVAVAPPVPTLAVPAPRRDKPRVIPVTKHAPELFAFGDADADAGVVTMPSRGGRRRLLLHTWAPPGAVDWRVFAVLPDGSIKPGPTTR